MFETIYNLGHLTDLAVIASKRPSLTSIDAEEDFWMFSTCENLTPLVYRPIISDELCNFLHLPGIAVIRAKREEGYMGSQSLIIPYEKGTHMKTHDDGYHCSRRA